MIVEHQSRLPFSGGDVFAWHARPGAFERLVPPWERARLVEPHPGLLPGAEVQVRVGTGPFARRWVARHADVEPGLGFTDVQVDGPFARWTHRHRFEPDGPSACLMLDRVECELPGGPLGELGEPVVRRRLQRLLRYRHRVVAGDLTLHQRYPGRRLRVAITGASGLIGSTLATVLTTGGHDVVRLVRRSPGRGEIFWDPARGVLDPESLTGTDAIVHLAGESIAGRRWTDAHKARIRQSRVSGTALIARAAAAATRPPRVLVSASAMGVYGDRGDELLDESSPPGRGFLPEVATAWEAAANPAQRAGIRVAHARFGLVLSPAGGLLERVRLPFALGLGGPLGSGRQWMSWIGIDDAVGALVHCLRTESVAGPVNVVAPTPVRNADFGATLGSVLRRPAVVPVPVFALRLVFGELAEEGLLASTRAMPAVLEATGYHFRHATLEPALRHLLGRAP